MRPIAGVIPSASFPAELVARFSGASRAIVANATWMIATTTITSAIGVAYWWVAARQFPQSTVGVAAASISAMTLLGTFGTLGIGTLLMGELRRQPGRESPLIATGLIGAAVAGSVFGIAFLTIAPHLSADLKPLVASPASSALFVAGVALTSASLVIDQALIGLLRGDLQTGRNALFALAKLAALALIAMSISDTSGMSIYASWVAGGVISLVGLALFGNVSTHSLPTWRPQWAFFRQLGHEALGHHALNLALQAPNLTLPLVVTALVSATMNASYYIASMVAWLVFVGPQAMTAVLYAVSASAPVTLAQRLRLTLGLSLLIGVAANGVLLIAGGYVLGIFGHTYSDEAQATLHLLVLGVFPLTVKGHYTAICRIHRRVPRAALWMTLGAIFEVVMAAGGAEADGLTGLCIGWLIATCLEAACVAPVVYTAAARVEPCRGG